MRPLPTFRDLVSAAESFEFYINAMEVIPPQASFYSTTLRPSYPSHPYSSSGDRSSSGSHAPSSGRKRCGRGGRGRGNRHPIYCQICRGEGHYSTFYHQRYNGVPPSSANIAESFAASCNISSPHNSDWYLDIGASAHMTPSSSTLDVMEPYSGNHKVLVGNGNVLPISHIGSRHLNSAMHLLDILVVPGLQKNLISISKLTRDFPVDAIFTNNSFLL
ncbi:hypothetical protein Fmac_029540 [Flemingia macrophylla]|uniref:Retrovirus-related Pol polyprotein from transposon TNT 1-94-like beta-barrel domain-containing protein n=1 Tax=Flemingia macrophylla TaxID=520843 RepID=A0ABD1LAT3_9FABA